MDASLVLAKIMGVLFLVVSVGLLTHHNLINEFIKKFKLDIASLYISSILRLLIGLLIVSFHNVWEMDRTIAITVLGWVSVVFGAAGVLAPRELLKLATKYSKNHINYNIPLGVMLVLSLFLIWFGFDLMTVIFG